MKQIIMVVVALNLMLNNLYSQETKSPTVMTIKPTVAVGKVIEVEDVESSHYTGLVISPSVVNVVPRVSGEIIKIGFKDGDYVKKGQILYQIDPIRYKASVKSAEAKIAEDNARLDYAQKDYDRNVILYKKEVVTQDDLENVKSTLDIYKANLLAAEADLILSKNDLDNTTIVAAIDGTIGVTNYTVGNYITSLTGELVSIIQDDPIRVRFSVSNHDFLSMFGSLKNLKENGSVRLRLADNSYYPLEGKIELINNKANEKTDTIQIYARFENPDKKLIPGSTITVILSKAKGDVLPAVLPSAVMYDDGGSYIYVVSQGNKAEKRDVVLGSILSDLQVIKSGVETGEVVVTDGMHKIMDGSEIEPIYKEE